LTNGMQATTKRAPRAAHPLAAHRRLHRAVQPGVDGLVGLRDVMVRHAERDRATTAVRGDHRVGSSLGMTWRVTGA
jgi:hypothetical protein